MDKKNPGLPDLSPEDLANPQARVVVNGIVVQLWQVAHLFGLRHEVPSAAARAGASAADFRSLHPSARPPRGEGAAGAPAARPSGGAGAGVKAAPPAAVLPILLPADAITPARGERQAAAGEAGSGGGGSWTRDFYRRMDEAVKEAWAEGRPGARRAAAAAHLRRTRSEIGQGGWPSPSLPPPSRLLPPLPPLRCWEPSTSSTSSSAPVVAFPPAPGFTVSTAPATTGGWTFPEVTPAAAAPLAVTTARRGPPPASMHNGTRARRTTRANTAGSPGPPFLGSSPRDRGPGGYFLHQRRDSGSPPPVPPLPAQYQVQQQQDQPPPVPPIPAQFKTQQQQQKQKEQDPGLRANPGGRSLRERQLLSTLALENVPPPIPRPPSFSLLSSQDQEEPRQSSRGNQQPVDMGSVDRPSVRPPLRQLPAQRLRSFSEKHQRPQHDHVPPSPGVNPTGFSHHQREPSVPRPTIPPRPQPLFFSSSQPRLDHHQQQQGQTPAHPIIRAARSFYHQRETSVPDSDIPPVPPLPPQYLTSFSAQKQQQRQKQQQQQEKSPLPVLRLGNLRPSVTGPSVVTQPVTRPATPPSLPLPLVDPGLQSRWSPDSSPEKVSVMKKVKKALSFARLRGKP